MSDKIIGLFFVVVVCAIIAAGSLVAYSNYSTSTSPTDMYGHAYSNVTNSTNQISATVAPPVIQVEGYLPLIGAVLLAFCCVFGLAVFVTKGGDSSGMRR